MTLISMLQVDGFHDLTLVDAHRFPKLKPIEILVKVHAVSIQVVHRLLPIVAALPANSRS
ncbi:hypothetical protein OH76DRAFT_1405765 [Lentinus brumalis]|uniref:Uncharacterized protein n=1 Tax=Lentinus brumalis TaxID=2498619 RepID=A0A371D5A0_9APHY|nr:hypothetical protein OH76DRAFT_1405765 [Polyporus brumalis]